MGLYKGNDYSYKSEFPDFDLQVEIPEGFQDDSWHNEAMPHWINTRLNISLWIDYSNPLDSEFEELRRKGSMRKFNIYQIDSDGHNEGVALLKTNDWLVAQRFIETYKGE